MNERKLLESDDPRYLAERPEQHYRLGEYTGGEATQNPWELVRDRLYGRLRYAIPLGLVLAAIGGAAGYLLGPVKYESQGMIRIVPNITPIMRETAETGVIPLYANFVQTQSTLLTSSRVLERAVQKLNVTELGWEDQQHALAEIQKVSADPDRGSEIIRVRYAAESAHVAQAVVNAVINAYDELYGSAHGEGISRTLQSLRNHRETLRTQQRQKRAQLENFIDASEYVVSDLETLISQKSLTVQNTEMEIARLQIMLDVALASRPPRNEAEQEAVLQPGDIPMPTNAQLEAADNRLARLGIAVEQAEVALEYARERFGVRHLSVRNAEEQLQVARRLYEERRELVERDWLEGALVIVDEAVDPVKELEHQIHHLKQLVLSERESTRRLARAQFVLSDLKAELADIEQELSHTNDRLRALELESEAIRSGRIMISAMGDAPIKPNQDRRMQLAAVGCAGGFGLGIGLFFLVGTLDRRAFMVNQLSGMPGGNRVIGVLPQLPRSRGAVEAAGVAAHCVHQIRNRIESIRGRKRSVVIAISSPNPSDGKTSLALSLGASYATAGSRTVVVDCDLIGQGVTQHSNMDGLAGLREALGSGRMDGLLHQGAIENLSVLPVGSDTHFGPAMIRRTDLEKLFDQLRSQFEIILVDTGPMLGSIESLPVAAAADGVLLTMRRGGRHSQLAHCIESLRDVGATYLGIVLNFARPADCARYTSTSKISRAFPDNDDSEYDGERRRSSNVLLSAMHTSGYRESRREE